MEITQLNLVILPLVGAAIGWFTNQLALVMLFRPIKPIKIPALGYTLQGVIPRRRDELAKSIGEIIERELVSKEDILRVIGEPGSVERLARNISELGGALLDQNFPRFIPQVLRSFLVRQFVNILRRNASNLMARYVETLQEQLADEFNIAEIVRSKLLALDISGLEQLAFRVARREMRQIVVVGGVLGFVIGLIQALVIIFIR